MIVGTIFNDFDPRSKGVKKGPFWDVIWFIQFILCQCLQIFKFFFTTSTTKTNQSKQSRSSQSKAKKNWSNGNWKNWKSKRKEKGAVTNVYFLQIKFENLIVSIRIENRFFVYQDRLRRAQSRVWWFGPLKLEMGHFRVGFRIKHFSDFVRHFNFELEIDNGSVVVDHVMLATLWLLRFKMFETDSWSCNFG